MQDQSITEVEYRPIEGHDGYRIGTDESVWSCWSPRMQELTDHWREIKKCKGRKLRGGGYGPPDVYLWNGKKLQRKSVRRLILKTFHDQHFCGSRGELTNHPGHPDLTGQTFHEWTVLKYHGTKSSGRHFQHRYLCRCSCGTERVVFQNGFRWGTSKSCGHGIKPPPESHVKGPTHPAWKGGRNKTNGGYISIRGSITVHYKDRDTVQEHMAVMSGTPWPQTPAR